jgi:hypothetical protein
VRQREGCQAHDPGRAKQSRSVVEAVRFAISVDVLIELGPFSISARHANRTLGICRLRPCAT